MRFLIDMNLSPKVAVQLRELGHDAPHLREEGLERLDDAAVFRKAAAENRVVVTYDLDFGEIVAQCAEARAGVILLRLRSPRRALVIPRIEAAVSGAGSALEEGAVVIVEERRIRTRRFPIGS